MCGAPARSATSEIWRAVTLRAGRCLPRCSSSPIDHDVDGPVPLASNPAVPCAAALMWCTPAGRMEGSVKVEAQPVVALEPFAASRQLRAHCPLPSCCPFVS